MDLIYEMKAFWPKYLISGYFEQIPTNCCWIEVFFFGLILISSIGTFFSVSKEANFISDGSKKSRAWPVEL